MINDLFRFFYRLAVAWPELSNDTSSLLRSLLLKNEAYLRKLCRYMPVQGEYSRGRGGYLYSSTMNDRFYQVIYRSHGKDRSKHELEIRVPVTQKFWLRLLPQASGSQLQDEIQVNDAELDGRFVIHSDQPEVAMNVLKTSFIRKELLALPQFKRLEVYRGSFQIVFLGPQSSGLKISEFEATVNFLVSFAAFYEAQKLDVKIVPVMHMKSFCPYCRESIDNHTQQVYSCPRCGAAMHLECWKENSKHCTTWGCDLSEAYA